MTTIPMHAPVSSSFGLDEDSVNNAVLSPWNNFRATILKAVDDYTVIKQKYVNEDTLWVLRRAVLKESFLSCFNYISKPQLLNGLEGYASYIPSVDSIQYSEFDNIIADYDALNIKDFIPNILEYMLMPCDYRTALRNAIKKVHSTKATEMQDIVNNTQNKQL